MAKAIVECLGEGTQYTKKVSVLTTEDKSTLTSHFFFLHRITCLLFSHYNAKPPLMTLLNHPQSISYSDIFSCVCF